TSRQIVSRDESHVLSREATGEDGRRVTSRAANGRRSTHVSIETRFSSGRRRAGRGVEADEDPSQVELNAVLRGKSRWRSTVQSESDLNQRLRSEVKSTSRQIVSRDESHVLSRERGEDGGGDVEGMLRSVLLSRIDGTGPEMAANGRRSTHVSIETRFSSGRRRAGRGVEADEDPSQVELNAVLRGKSRWRSTVQSESDLNQRLRSEVKLCIRMKCFRKRFKMDESMTGPSGQSVIVRRDRSRRVKTGGGDVEGMLRSVLLSRIDGTGPEMAANGRRSTHVSIETRFSSGRRRAGRGVEADEDPSQVELNAVLRGKSRWRSTVQSESDLNQRLRSEVKSTSRQIVSRDESHVLSREREEGDVEGLGGDGEGGQRPPFNTRLNRNALLEWATAAGRGVEADEDPSQVELNAVLRGKSRWRSTVQSESDLNQRLRSEVKSTSRQIVSRDESHVLSREATGEDGRRVTSRTVPAPRMVRIRW
ncbi:hypothetical protein BDZ89DRAFT_1053365, partial [Hymenopellis radicata]